MTFEGLNNQKICAGEHQPQVNLAKNRKNLKNAFYFILKALFFLKIFNVFSRLFDNVENTA